MSRLIDADDLIKMFEEGVWNDAVEVVREQPTAYDADKVLKQLNEKIVSAANNLRDNMGTAFEFSSRCTLNAYKEAYEIVKKGDTE